MEIENIQQSPPNSRRVIHVDINSYFATMLQQENPFLRGRPVGVLKSQGRTMLIAASKEAKARGIHSPTNVKEARLLAPDLVTVPVDFDRCLDCTKRLQQIFLSLSPHVHIFSLDEAFLDITDCQKVYPDAVDFGKQVQRAIKKELGEWVTCNVGVSHTRLLAKLASEVSKPDTVTEITLENQDAYLANANFRSVCGIGFGLSAKLERLGIHHPYEINFWSDEDLLPTFGPFWTPELKRIARGEDSHCLDLLDEHEDQDMKSVGRTLTGWQLCNNETQIKQVIYNLTEELIHKVRKMKMAGRHAGIGLWGDDHHWFAHRTLQYHVNHTNELFHLLYDQLYCGWQRDFKIIKYGVFLSGLSRTERLTESFLPKWEQQEKISTAMDALTEKYGLFTVKPASLLGFQMIRPEVTGFLGDKKYYGLG